MSASEPDAIMVRDLSCRLGGRPVLDRVGFSAAAGEYLSIIGPNGAGKSTLLKCLNGILRDWDGEILLQGAAVKRCRQRDLALRAAYVPQVRTAAVGFEVVEFIMMSRYARRPPWSAPGRDDQAAVERALALTGTAGLRGRLLGTLSGGEAQKVSIAAALAQEAPILLLDEPITFLDPRYQHEVNLLLKDLNRSAGLTVVAVSHDINSAVLSSHRILGLKNGRVACHGLVEEVVRPEPLAELFGTEFLFVPHPHSGVPLVVPRH